MSPPKFSVMSQPLRAIVKMVSMCTGELEFDSIFHQEPSGERDELSDVPFFFLSYLFWTAFIIFIPILLINMLVCCRTTTYLDIPLYTWVGLDKIDELSVLYALGWFGSW